ncbi:MAG: DoxX family membrane protein [Candidatus Krumholzibacteria bacterium]|nr:DoxX family membrane protein [Candidatus Krumholzibacteria bacterium]
MTIEESTIRSTNPLTILLTNKVFIFALRIVLGGMFIYSSTHKIWSPEEFAIAIRSYELLPVGLTNLFALLIAWSEALAGIMLILGVMTKKAAGAILLMLVMFTVAVLATMIKGLVIDCGCFGADDNQSTSLPLVIRNLFLIAAAAMVMLFDRGAWSVSSVLSKRR